MARKGIEKMGRAKERLNLRGYVGTEFFGYGAQLVYQCRPTVDDGDDVLEVMTHKKIPVTAAFERFGSDGERIPPTNTSESVSPPSARTANSS